ncbi:MAG: hypothetical protein N2255_07485 [Kiritimatiellae bacterium]|nr:hypothetical protein [Kiritimatiellia bacterium]
MNYFIEDHEKFDYGHHWPMSRTARRKTAELVKQRNRIRREFRMFNREAFTDKELREVFGELKKWPLDEMDCEMSEHGAV